ncbi:C69 family dipeptidase [Companilactobacillus alimentarius]|uniref:Dipeptidase n=1 Tax=Companilactobacillus alimentarius DSM 20249 TaxID=1423720 RepID=A0A2K9HGL5_9LACO|nr:C69 family dipeptidase [Companilactobacillus alimentarius]AUI70916.1 dipeptidase [Companilactobacillus alimentarius DSM 20249]MDT6951890.1 C69 family dipeptidase [Companilactobacillus alimentarius]GEO44201.1 dipeptidase [Companilactobacillus alimentarius]
MALEYNKSSLSACTSILIGKKATVDGSTIIGRNEDAKASWPKHFVIHEHKESTEKQRFVSKANDFQMDLPKIRNKYSATPEWTFKEGLFEEDGFNEYGVGMSATESAYSNQRVLGVDPLVENGIGEEAMITVVLPYVKTAREGVLRLGEIVEKYGTCETNGVLFSDQNEVWYFENGSGHYWVAQRIPDDSYAVVANQLAIQEIDFNDENNFLYHQDIQKFVSDNHLNTRPNTFNFREIFGTHNLSDEIYSTPRVWWGQQEFSGKTDESPESENLSFIKKADRLLSVDDAKNYLSSHFQGTPYDPLNKSDDNKRYRPISLAKTQESHVLQIRPQMAPEIACVQWLAMGVASQSVYVPFYMGINNTPEAYKIGELPYDSKSAYWTYKLAGVLLDGHYNELGKMFQDKQEAINITLYNKLHEFDQQALSKDDEELPNYLTKASFEMAKISLDGYKELIAQLITDSTDFSPLNFKTDMNL